MAKSKKILHEEIRNRFLAEYIEFLQSKGEECLQVKTNEIAVPTLDSEGSEEWCVITFKVPTGSRDDGEAYDGYSIAEQFKENQEAKAEKAKAEAEKKARKIARDKAMREAKAKARAEHENKKENGE